MNTNKTRQQQGKASRRKGASGERELINLLRSRWPDLLLRRDLRQYQQSGLTDILGLDGYVIEVKRRRSLGQADVERWWQPLVRNADGQEPVLAYRQDRQDWRFRMLGSGNFWLETDFEGFCRTLTIKGDTHGTASE